MRTATGHVREVHVATDYISRCVHKHSHTCARTPTPPPHTHTHTHTVARRHVDACPVIWCDVVVGSLCEYNSHIATLVAQPNCRVRLTRIDIITYSNDRAHDVMISQLLSMREARGSIPLAAGAGGGLGAAPRVRCAGGGRRRREQV